MKKDDVLVEKEDGFVTVVFLHGEEEVKWAEYREEDGYILFSDARFTVHELDTVLKKIHENVKDVK